MQKLSFDSKEEEYFSWWLDDLVKAGLVKSWKYQPESFPITMNGWTVAKLDIPWVKKKQQKRGVKHEEKLRHMIRTRGGDNLVYTPDFFVEWADGADGIITLQDGGKYFVEPPLYAMYGRESWIEVKGSQHQRHQSEEATKIRIALLWVAQGKVTEMVRPTTTLFKNTFYPERYFLVDGGTGPRCKVISKRKVPLSMVPGVKKCAQFIKEMREKNCL